MKIKILENQVTSLIKKTLINTIKKQTILDLNLKINKSNKNSRQIYPIVGQY